MKKALHFGAGKLGKAIIAPIYQLNNYKVTFVDHNDKMVEILSKNKKYTIYPMLKSGKTKKITNFSIISLNNKKEILNEMLESDIISTSIVPTNLIHIKDLFNEFLKIKKETNNKRKVNIICIENGIKISDDFEAMLSNTKQPNVGFINAIADGICMFGDNLAYEDVMVEQFSSLDLESKNWIGPKLNKVGYHKELLPVIIKKFWMLNSSQALISFYISGQYKFMGEYIKNKQVVKIANEYLDWIINVLLENYEVFTKKELLEYKKFWLDRLSKDSIVDPVSRVSRNFKLKVSYVDRFVSIINKASNKEYGINFLKNLYKLNEEKVFDKEIANYSKEFGIKKAILKFSELKI